MKHLNPNEIDLLAFFASHDPMHVFVALTVAGLVLALFLTKGRA